MPQWCIEFDGTVEVEADTEAEALAIAWERVHQDPRQHLFAEAEEQKEEEGDDDDEENDEDGKG